MGLVAETLVVEALVVIEFLSVAFVAVALVFEVFGVGMSPFVRSMVKFWRAVSEAAIGSSWVAVAMPTPAWAGGCVKWFHGSIYGISWNPKLIPDYTVANLFPFSSETRGFQRIVLFLRVL